MIDLRKPQVVAACLGVEHKYMLHLDIIGAVWYMADQVVPLEAPIDIFDAYRKLLYAVLMSGSDTFKTDKLTLGEISAAQLGTLETYNLIHFDLENLSYKIVWGQKDNQNDH